MLDTDIREEKTSMNNQVFINIYNMTISVFLFFIIKRFSCFTTIKRKQYGMFLYETLQVKPTKVLLFFFYLVTQTTNGQKLFLLRTNALLYRSLLKYRLHCNTKMCALTITIK